MVSKPVPAAIRRSLTSIGEDLATWRRLRNLTINQVAERADVARSVVMNLEAGQGATLGSTLRIARALGILDAITSAVDPYRSDVGRLRADEALPQRVRHRSQPDDESPR